MGGQSPISFQAMDRYAERYGLTGTDFEIFHAIVSAVDDEFLQHVQREFEAEQARQRQNQPTNGTH